MSHRVTVGPAFREAPTLREDYSVERGSTISAPMPATHPSAAEPNSPSIGGRMEALEQRVRDSVRGGRAAMTGTAEAVRDAVGDAGETVESALTATTAAVRRIVRAAAATLRHGLDVRDHVPERPWLMI